jgi:hypothetical protein
MKTVNWNLEKAQLIKETRGIDMDRVATLIEEGKIQRVHDVPSRPGQKMFVIEYDNYMLSVPFVENEQEIFIKTAYRNRKLNKFIRVGGYAKEKM